MEEAGDNDARTHDHNPAIATVGPNSGEQYRSEFADEFERFSHPLNMRPAADLFQSRTSPQSN
jgi:hypothetical protein